MKSRPHDPAALPFALDADRGWTPRRLAALRVLVRNGASNTAIARALGVTRSCIRKTVARLGLDGKPRTIVIKPDAPRESQLAPYMRAYHRQRASYLHLIDLKRAGHSPTATKLRIAPDATPRPWRFPSQLYSQTGSPAAMTAEA